MPALRYTGASRASMLCRCTYLLKYADVCRRSATRIARVYAMPVCAGGFHSVCLLRDPPETVTFGYNRFGQLGLGGMSNGPNGRWDDGTLLDDLDAFSQQV